MIFSPDDPGINPWQIFHYGSMSRLINVNLWALFGGQQSPSELFKETRRLLYAVDAATTTAQRELAKDRDIEALARQWALLGAGIFAELDRLSMLEKIESPDDLVILAGAYALLTARKLTFELNGILVPVITTSPVVS